MGENLLEQPDLVDQTTLTSERVHVGHGVVSLRAAGDPGDEALTRIRSMAPKGSKIEAKDVYTFDMYAASNGVDSYWTQQDEATSLRKMGKELERGQALLGNHAYDTYAIGSSFDARVEKLKQDDPFYEETFWGPAEREEMKATHGLLGSYFVGRGLELNGEKTDSIIRGIEIGQQRKASISFIPAAYVCGLDGLPMIMAAFAALAAEGGEERASKRHDVEEPDPECWHFPGVRYEEGIAWAIMQGSTILETSLVYKNSSPSALMKRAAAMFATRGVLNRRQAAQVEVALGIRMPLFERSIWTPGGKEDSVAGAASRQTVVEVGSGFDTGEAAASTEPDEPTGEAEASTEEPEASGEAEPAGEQPEGTAETVVAQFVAASVAVRSAVGAQLLSTEQLDQIGSAMAAADREVAPLSEASPTRVAQREAIGLRDTRDAELEEAFGAPLTVSAVRSMRANATAFEGYFEELVRDAIAARNGLGIQYDVAAYESFLRDSRNVAFVKGERSTYEELKKKRFVAGRTTEPGELRTEPAPKGGSKKPAAAETAGKNMLEREAAPRV